MTVHSKPLSTDGKKDPKKSGDFGQSKPVQDKNQTRPVSTRTGKEQDAVYDQQSKLLLEVQEKYKEADLEVQKQLETVLGQEVRAKSEAVIPPDVEDSGVVSPADQASRVVKKGSNLELPVSEDEYKKAGNEKVGGKRLLNKTIVGVSSLAAVAIYVGKLIKAAHRHARRVVFKDTGSGPASGEGVNAG